MSSLAKEHRERVQAFVKKVATVQKELASAPKQAGGVELPAGESLRVWKKGDKPANTLVIHEQDFEPYLVKKIERIDYGHSKLGPETTLELQRLIYWTNMERWSPGEERSKTRLEPFVRVLAWYQRLRYVAVIIPEEVVDYRPDDTTVAAKWAGRVAVWDLEQSKWLGAVTVSLQGKRAKIFEYEYVDSRTGASRGPAGRDVKGDQQSARFQLNTLLNKAVRLALESGKAVTELNQVAKKKKKQP